MGATISSRLRGLLLSGYAWVFLGAVVLRAVYLWQAWRGNDLIACPLVDARVYVNWAKDILAGNWLWYDAKTYTPGVPLWLAGWFAVFGERAWLHFAGFHLLGAVQAVLIGKTAEAFWDRRAGLVAGWLAALYWPLVVFEATYYAEPLAMLNLSIALLLLARWSRGLAGRRALVWSGFCLGVSILARANAMLLMPVAALWIFVVVWKGAELARWRRVFAAWACIFLPPAMLCLPIVAWNWKVTGVAEIRTGSWLSVYLGNNPEYRGLVVPVGLRWSDFVYQPIRAGHVERQEQNDFWRAEVFRVIRERPVDWARLMGRKALMLTGNFEVSQEIDVGVFRTASRALALPGWPGWWLVFPLAAGTAAAMWRSRSARFGWPLLLVAVVYLASVAPVQAAARYRLPVVVPMLPLAGWFVVHLAGRLMRRDFAGFTAPAAAVALAAVLACPDWLGLRDEKIVNHHFLVGIMRDEAGDDAGAEAAFEQGAAWNASDPDCPYRLGKIWLKRNRPLQAMTCFGSSLGLFPRGYETLLGLAECALAAGLPADALGRVDEALRLAPGNSDAYAVAVRAHTASGDWVKAAEASAAMRANPLYPASVAFTELRALSLAKRANVALPLLDEVAEKPWHTTVERGRAKYLAGVLAWRLGQRKAAIVRWKALASGPPGAFPMLGESLSQGKTPAQIRAGLPAEQHHDPHVLYALALAAIQRGDPAAAVTELEAIIGRRQARALREGERELLEIWALEDLAGAPPKPLQ